MEEANEKDVFIMSKVRIAILRTDGTNCDEQTFYGFELAGGKPQMVHVNDLLKKKDKLDSYQIVAIPGGFSYGDDILSGKILANELSYKLGRDFKSFIKKGKLIIGICNGFQVLVRMGLLPEEGRSAKKVSLIFNDSAKFECRWIKLRIEKSVCVFTQGLEGKAIELPVNHGEGKLIVKNNKTLDELNYNHQVVFRYAHADGSLATDYPANPNGSIEAVAGITNQNGTILGMMPHPERYVKFNQHPNWTRQRPWKKEGDGLVIFKNAVEYAKRNL